VSGGILVLAPHPDDEVVGFAALIGRRRAAGVAVSVLFLTDGVPPADLMWPWSRRRRAAKVARRRAEAVDSCRMLDAGVAGFLDIPSRRLKDNLDLAGAAVVAAVERLGVDVLWVPAYEGGHQDHDAASFLAAGLAGIVAVREAPLYSFADGRVRRQEFIAGPESAEEAVLTAEERERKRALLAVYASERGNLGYVGVEREALRPPPPTDYSRPPHPGKTFYQRFQWVPFRHPRVDFTTPEEVCRRLMGRGRDR
jgi:LmbE family N-acetylglucosaminyl deacetylase